MFRISDPRREPSRNGGVGSSCCRKQAWGLPFRAKERPTTRAGGEGVSAEMAAKLIALCGIVLMLAGCAQPEWTCTGNGGTTHNSGALCSELIPLSL